MLNILGGSGLWKNGVRVGIEPSIGGVYRGYGVVGHGNGVVMVYRGPGRGRHRNWFYIESWVRIL